MPCGATSTYHLNPNSQYTEGRQENTRCLLRVIHNAENEVLLPKQFFNLNLTTPLDLTINLLDIIKHRRDENQQNPTGQMI